MDDRAWRPDDFASEYEAAARRLFARIERACTLDAPWPERVRVAVEMVLGFLGADPARARLVLIEPHLHGGEAQQHYEESLARLVNLLAVGRETAGVPALPEAVEQGLIGGAAFIVGRALQAGESELLPSLAPELTAFLLTPYLGREEAERVAAAGNQPLE